MSEDSLGLRTFILGDPPDVALSQCVASINAALGTSLFDARHFDWSSLAGEISEKLEQMFDIQLTDILAAGWKDYQALLDCADPSKHNPDEMISLPMVDHRIETALKPCLAIAVGERQPVRITFEIDCELELKGLVARIQDASIRALRIGSCRAKGTVKCEGVLLIKRETRELDLPGRIVLAHAIRSSGRPLAVPRKAPTTGARARPITTTNYWQPSRSDLQQNTTETCKRLVADSP